MGDAQEDIMEVAQQVGRIEKFAKKTISRYKPKMN
eukprot:CAMPEP_0183707656 /NCGR_PEP_ID=MMETSP0737-20130205/4179_1 /TAXON_ID=385413 /ORGANISM="Thalassiosira miniscula, Strain CCMP1093" /LENGTH=34 /DNA_ID= /DNA_START= /DNA_END= /DNA_ORIENTATION=